MDNKKWERAKTLSEVINKIRQQGGTFRRQYGPGDYVWRDTQIPQDKDLTPGNIKEQIKKNREMEKVAEDARIRNQQEQDIIKKEIEDAAKQKNISKPSPSKSKTPTDVVYNKTGQLVDLSGKPIKPRGGGGKLGLIAGLALAGAGSLIPKDSWAASALEKVSEAMDEADPQYQMGKAIKEGMEQSDALLEQVQKKRMLNELQKKAAEEDKIRKEKEAFLKQDITPVVELLGGKPAIKPKEAEMMTGEVPAGEEDILSVENSDRKMRNKLGYK